MRGASHERESAKDARSISTITDVGVNKAAVELSQSLRLGLMPSDTADNKEMPEGAESADE